MSAERAHCALHERLMNNETVAVQSYKPGSGFVANHVAEFSNRLNCVSNLQRQNRKLQILGTLCLETQFKRFENSATWFTTNPDPGL